MNLADPIFHDDEAARLHLEARRWPNGPCCPHCGEDKAITRLGGASTAPGMLICRSCRLKFSVTAGTIFERSHIGLAKWLLALRLMTASKRGASALQLSRSLGVTYKTAWLIARRIRGVVTLDTKSHGPIRVTGSTQEARGESWPSRVSNRAVSG